jgi:uncharacterized protein YndB with AHSA1/START domain
MTTQQRSAVHNTFQVERGLAAPPSKVFTYWSVPELKAQWFKGPEGWDEGPYLLEFRVGGGERSSGSRDGGPVFRYEATVQEIVPDERIVSTYNMFMDDTLISVSTSTVELVPEGEGTRLTLTEQDVYLDGNENGADRGAGVAWQMDNLKALLEDA